MGGGPPEFPQGFTCLVVLRIPLAALRFRIRGFHPVSPAFPKLFCYPPAHLLRSITPKDKSLGLGSFHFARHYFGNRFFFLFLQVLRCFSSLRWPSIRVLSLQLNRLSHSDMCGSSPVCRSPHLFAAFHVLLRLQKPRHPPFALCNFFFVNHIFADMLFNLKL